MPETAASAHQRMMNVLAARKAEGAFRKLRSDNSLIDFSSNDYLGFAASAELAERIQIKLRHQSAPGSKGSRLLSGNTAFAESLEAEIAAFHGAEAGLIFNSGYDANTGLFSCIASREDTILYDSLIHASVRDGIRLSKAAAFSFRHNDLAHLEERLQAAAKTGQVFVGIESVYSMDGDLSDIAAINRLCKHYGAELIVDEAHATGVFGKKGEGLVNEALAPGEQLFARVHTFGKALGCHGAIVLGSPVLRDWLINYSRSFIYTTALPPSSLAAAAAAYELLAEKPELMVALQERIAQFSDATAQQEIKGLLPSRSPIQCLLVPGNIAARALSDRLAAAGFDVRAILSPTVPAGAERLRICIHRFNSVAEIQKLAEILGKFNGN
jgi:8-amino-7-oxononanoate synthase